jgi:hypothetical protein
MMRRPYGWDPSAHSGESKPEQVRQCMALEHCLHWLHLEPTHLVHREITLEHASIGPEAVDGIAVPVKRHVRKLLRADRPFAFTILDSPLSRCTMQFMRLAVPSEPSGQLDFLLCGLCWGGNWRRPVLGLDGGGTWCSVAVQCSLCVLHLAKQPGPPRALPRGHFPLLRRSGRARQF